MTAKKKLLTLIFVLGLFLLGVSTTFGASNFCYAQSEREEINSRQDFATALSKKQSVINVGDIDFGATPIAIDISYSVEIVGKNQKSLFLNAHFNIVGGTTANDVVHVTIKNIKFDGGFDTQNKTLENGKTFAENFGTDRTNPVYKAIVPTGLFDLKIENCEFFGYASQSGAVIYRLNTEASSIRSNLKISNTKVYDNICEESPLYIVDKSLNLKIENSEFCNNITQFCGGISIWGANSELDGVSIHDNKFVNFCSVFDKYSGGLFVAMSDILIKNSNISNNSAYNGGGVQVVNSNATFFNCKILNNKTFATGTSKAGILYCEGGYGGGVLVISNEGQIVKFENCNISANSAVNGGAIAVMPASQNAKGGQVELYFCNIGLNNQNDNQAIKYYGYSEQNKGLLLAKGCIIVDQTSIENIENDYNYISTKEQALADKVISESIIENIATDGLVILPNSSADRSVPKTVCDTWNLYFTVKGNRKIGVQNVEETNNLALVISLSITAFIVTLAGVAVLILLLKRKKSATNQQKEMAEITNPTPSVANKPITVFTNEQIEIILKNVNDDVALSKKEIDVFKLSLLGKSRKEMASESFVTEHTIKKHLSSIYDKLGVGTRKELYEKAKQYLK